ncbi:GNAT family N-acetyltransferase [Dongia sp.]|uniref:GNAT family N-acetyltransferase n=1 Tax=Dongia sp. TaxID=1977262 RepID=UPI0035ADA846
MHSDLIFRVENFADPARRRPWLDLLDDIFGIDLTAFNQLGIWSAEHRAFCYWDGGTLAAHVAYRPVPLTVDGTIVAAGQIHGVATRAPYRQRGLFQDLMGRCLAHCDAHCDLQFLYTETPDLYTPFGFRILPEYSFRGRFAGTSGQQPSSRPLTPIADLALIQRLFAGRRPVSERLGLCANVDIFLIHAIAHPHWHLSYLQAEDVLVVWEKATRRRLIDIAGARLPAPQTLLSLLGEDELDILFPPDLLDGSFTPVPHVPEDNDLLMVRGHCTIREPVMLPLTAVS